MFKDYEKYLKNADIVACDFDVVEALQGIVYVDLVEDGEGYKVVEHYGGLDITEYYGDAWAKGKTTVLPDATEVTYADGILSITGEAKLAAPSVLQGAGVVGIEQW